MSANYDRLYDMATSRHVGGVSCCVDNCYSCNAMRKTGLEPVSLAAPDPKSHPLAGSPPVSECASATSRHLAPPNATQTTTNSTTCGFSKVPLVAREA